MDYFKISIIQVLEMDGINFSDYPDFCDAFITSACYLPSGQELTEEELEKLNDDNQFVHEQVYERIF